MKRLPNKVMLTALLVALSLLFSGTINAQPIELSWALEIAPTHLRYKNILEPWSKMVEERTGGKVKIVPLFSCALGSFAEAFDSAKNGIADMSEGVTRDIPGRFTLSETLGLPGVGLGSSVKYSRAFWHLYNSMPEVKETCNGVKVLWLYASPPALLLSKKPVRTLEDLKGMKIRVVGNSPKEIGKALGFTPVSVSMGELYMALEKGIVDGAMAPNETMAARRLGEVVKYVTEIDLGSTLFFMVMNQNTWDRLPPDVQKVIDELSGEWAVEFGGKAWDKFDEETKDVMREKGVEYIKLSPEENKRWLDKLQPVLEAQVEALEAKGYPGKKLLEEVIQLRNE